ncbi:MAG: response regulator protein [Candidatus Abyssobacteria bacterium SURF_17]|uniref:histidine kinase n=1 Tax=Candidatus Abyssobacteria bacterium SURF_17 TaxID=2093361 RepID=A0A419EPA7_9BACT|nr:MAG: response regulator protein [Candidatus Abyssubacteria bacterium SURF_17]
MYTSKNIETLVDVRTALHASSHLSDLLDLIARRTTEFLNAKGAFVQLIDIEKDTVECAGAHGWGERYLPKWSICKHEIIRNQCRLGKILIITDILNDARVQNAAEMWDDGVRMAIFVCLTLQSHIGGIIRIFFPEARKLSQEERSFLVTVATCGACAIESARLLENQKSLYDHLALQTEKLSALGRMAAGIAHEINNPLAGILLYSTNLLKKASKDGPFKEALEIIVHETKRCGDIIQDLLDFSREGEPKKALVNINDVTEKAVSILENEFRLHHIKLEKQLSPELPDTYVDANQMEQVFVDVLLNAIEAVQERGVITIESRLGSDGKSEVIKIGDTGCGIPQENLAKIFEPFFSTKSNGTGLGLAVSYGIVQKHGGNIHVASQPGQGTCFTIELPIPDSIPSKEVTTHPNGSH